MKPTVLTTLRRLTCTRRRRIALVLGLTVGLVLLAGPAAGANDVYSNIGPAPQLPSGGLVGRYPLANYQLDQYFPGVSVGVFSGVDVSGVPPLIAFFIAQIIWLITAFLANAVITLFAFAFNLDLVNGNGTPGSGALTPVASAIHNLYTNTFGAPWLVAVIVLAGCWAMWKALVQRRYTETAGALGVSLLYCVLAIGIVTQPQRTIAPASKLSNQLSTSLLSLTSQGSIGDEQQAKTAASNQLFSFLVLDPWTVLEFGGIEHCTTTNGGKSVAVRPLSANAGQDTQLASQLEAGTEVGAQGKTCINNRNKYASHFLAYPFQSKARNSEHEALEKGDTGDLPSSDPAKTNGTYTLGKADEPAAEAMGKGGQYQRLLLSIVILVGEIGAFLLLGALALGVILAQLLLLLLLCFAPVALLIGIFPGRGHDFFRAWLGKLAGYLARKVIYSLILAVTLAVSQALADATSNLGWLLAFVLQATFLWMVFIQRERLTSDLLTATAGPNAARDGSGRLQNLYYATRLTQMARRRKQSPKSPQQVEVVLSSLGGSPGASPDPDSTPTDTPEEEPV
jgi:TrbL/VirB6 plasmid conjugal transfer protein